MAGLDLDYIIDEEGLDLFNDDGQQQTPPAESEDEGNKDKGNKNTAEEEEVDVDSLFQNPESVGGGEEHNGEGEDTTPDEGKTSPNFFSSNAKALAEEGIFPDLDEEEINNIKTGSDLVEAIRKQMKAGLDEMQKRVTDALEAGVETPVIKQYEGVLKQLNDMTDEEISAEGDEGEILRKKLIFQDYLNRGFSKERAEREVNKAIQNGTDIDDAKEALKSNKQFFQDAYNKILQDAKDSKKKEEEEDRQKAEKLKESLLNPKTKFFDELELDKSTRQKVLDNISKPIYKDPKTGDVFTAVQKYELEHGEDFLVKVGLLYTLTDGFKSLDGLVKGKVNKEMKKGYSALESKINNTARDNEGNLRYSSGVDDSEDYLGKGIRLDI
jgi:hypothetical protein